MDVPQFSQPVDDYPPFEAVTKCDPTPKPGVVAFRDWIIGELGGEDWGISRRCHDGKPTSRHHEGRAWDWAPPTQAAANQLLDCLLRNEHELARRAGIRVIIWDHKIWTPRTKNWEPYTKPNPHTDHIHFAFSWDGAYAKTTLYTLEPSGNAVVASMAQPVDVVELGSPDPAGMVPARRTPLTEQALAEVLAAGHIRVFGEPPSYYRLGVAWAQVNHETGRTKSAYNYNWGNIICTKSWPGNCHRLGGGLGPKGDQPGDFRAYGSPLEGAEDYWRLLNRRYSDALEAFDDGDPEAAAAELRRKGWYEGDEAIYAGAMSAFFDEYERTFRDSDWRRRLAPLVLTAGLAAAAAYFYED
jgi:hypothetical protein